VPPPTKTLSPFLGMTKSKPISYWVFFFFLSFHISGTIKAPFLRSPAAAAHITQDRKKRHHTNSSVRNSQNTWPGRRNAKPGQKVCFPRSLPPWVIRFERAVAAAATAAAATGSRRGLGIVGSRGLLPPRSATPTQNARRGPDAVSWCCGGQAQLL
jgi:hypothetical protein